MSDSSNRIILGRERFKGSIDVNSEIPVNLNQTMKELIEYDKSVDLNLVELFDEERQQSTIFRPVTKFTVLFENALTGYTTYEPFRNNLYYTNEVINAINAFPGGNVIYTPPPPVAQTPWEGYPQYFEFDFIRTDNNVIGYTKPPNAHIQFKNVSATTYNWFHCLTYPFENDYKKTLYVEEPNTNLTWTWVVADGIPFYITIGSDQTTRQIRFKCPMPHGLTAGEYVQLSINYNGQKIFQVSSLGDPAYGSNDYIFNISNVGFTGSTFLTNTQGTFKRIINLNDVQDTKSEYYIRKHKVLTDQDCVVLANAGFEQNIFATPSKYERAAVTPNQQFRSSLKEGGKSYTLSFNCDINIEPFRDNQKRPLTQLFFTTIWRGYFGWTRNLKQGWYFNTFLKGISPSPWWDQSNPLSNTSITQSSYTVGNNGPFYYNNILSSGDTIDGDFCEWNNYDQAERVISRYTHKFKFNKNYFTLVNNLNPTNQYGYFYNPHNPIQIGQFSNYVEESNSSRLVGLPDYSYYSQLSNNFRWRDILPYGYIDEDSNGVDFPFLNGKHYPFVNTIFRITPEYYNVPNEYIDGAVGPNITTITDPVIDECE